MELVPYKTTPESLSFNVRMVARLAAPLAFFYLGWISENGIKDGPWTANNAPSIITYRNVTIPNINQTYSPSVFQTVQPSPVFVPSASILPSYLPTFKPTSVPTHSPTFSPSNKPTHQPSHFSMAPTPVNFTYAPTFAPSNGTSRPPTVHNRTELIAIITPGGLPMPSCFSHFYQLQAVSSLKSTFGTFFPVLLFCVMFLISTNILNYILICLKAEYLQFGSEIVTEAQLKEGRRQLDRHRRSTVLVNSLRCMNVFAYTCAFLHLNQSLCCFETFMNISIRFCIASNSCPAFPAQSPSHPLYFLPFASSIMHSFSHSLTYTHNFSLNLSILVLSLSASAS